VYCWPSAGSSRRCAHRKFFSIEELNQAIRELRDRINQRPFRKREDSRAAQFAALDKPALNPLPAEPFDLSQWSRARVNIDYHIVFDTNYYSVPYNLVQELVEVRSTPTTVEIFHKGQRVASHLRGQTRKHFRAGTNRGRQKLRGFNAGAESLSRRILGTVHARSVAVSRFGDSTCRWQPAQSACSHQSHRRAGHRGLGHDSADRFRQHPRRSP
jgi:hypothetical protein